jgi:hypothetical protein
MAKVTVQVLGADHPTVLEDVDTVGDVKGEMGVPDHQASVDGEPADDNSELWDGAFVDLAPSVKAG